jgi:uncharacterized protein (DUF1330 family)
MRALAVLTAILVSGAAQAQTASVPANMSAVNAPKALDTQVCDNKPVIMVVNGLILDPARLGAYAKAIRDSGLYPQLAGYYMNSPRPVAVFEGAPPPNASMLLVRFPCLAHARAFWYSKTYQETIVPLRVNPPAGEFTVTVYAEADLPAYMKGRVKPGGYAPKQPAKIVADLEKLPVFQGK